MTNKSYVEGSKAHRLGLCKARNPHTYGTYLYWAWLSGWIDSENALKETHKVKGRAYFDVV